MNKVDLAKMVVEAARKFQEMTEGKDKMAPQFGAATPATNNDNSGRGVTKRINETPKKQRKTAEYSRRRQMKFEHRGRKLSSAGRRHV